MTRGLPIASPKAVRMPNSGDDDDDPPFPKGWTLELQSRSDGSRDSLKDNVLA
ncbi:hypothetical protein OC846_000612, partial [Tilletia horrida]